MKWLKTTCQKNLNSLTTNKVFRDQVRKESISIPDGEYCVCRKGRYYWVELKNFSIMATLVTNELFLTGLRHFKIENNSGGTYQFFNTVNENLPIYYDNKTNRYRVRDSYGQHPVQGITWRGAESFAILCGGRLITELEWEICARSGVPIYSYPWGNSPPIPERGNYANMIADTTPVRKYLPNPWGLYDMAGNLREWCADPYHPDYPFLVNTPSLKKVVSEYRVVKGGAWDKTSSHLKISTRAGKWWRVGTAGIGFRIVFER